MSEPFRPGDHVRTPYGLAWVNIPPPGERAKSSKVFVRLGDDSTRWIDEAEAVRVNF